MPAAVRGGLRHVRVAFFGLGAMGRPMASRLVTATAAAPETTTTTLTTVEAHDVDADKVDAFVAAHGAAARRLDLAGAGRDLDIVVLSLPGPDEVLSALRSGVLDRLPPSAVVLDTSTLPPAAARDHAALLHPRGLRYVDAPVTGESARAATGDLTVITSGDPAALDSPACRAVLARIGSKIVFAGERQGSAQLGKALNNCLYNASVAAMAEVLPVARANGLDPATLVEIVTHGTGQSFGFDKFAPLVLARQFDAPEHGYPMGAAFKDMRVVAEAAAGGEGGSGRRRLRTPVLDATRGTYEKAVAMGLGDEVKGAMCKVYEAEALQHRAVQHAAVVHHKSKR